MTAGKSCYTNFATELSLLVWEVDAMRTMFAILAALILLGIGGIPLHPTFPHGHFNGPGNIVPEGGDDGVG
jgi:hypothetical protein